MAMLLAGTLAGVKRHAAVLLDRADEASHAMSVKAIPHIFFQICRDRNEERNLHGDWIDAWHEMNPQYTMQLLDDAACVQFALEHASHDELRALELVRPGPPRADVCRLIVLKYQGGVYADTDVEPLQPLSKVIPPNATAVSFEGINGDGHFLWARFTLLAFAPAHPLIESALARVVGNVEAVARRVYDTAGLVAHSSYAIVTNITGPEAFDHSLNLVWVQYGCRIAKSDAWPCRYSDRGDVMRYTYFHLAHGTLAGLPDAGASNDSKPERRVNVIGDVAVHHTDETEHTCLTQGRISCDGNGDRPYLHRKEAVHERDRFRGLPSPAGRRLIGGVHWLHIPRAGTSLLTAVINAACPRAIRSALNGSEAELPVQMWQTIRSKRADLVPESCDACSDCNDAHRLELVLQEHCTVSPWFSVDSEAGLPSALNDADSMKSWLSRRPYYWRDGQMLPPPRPTFYSAPQVVVLVREPIARLVSSYNYGLHDVACHNPDNCSLVDLIHNSPDRWSFFVMHACAVQTRFLAGALSFQWSTSGPGDGNHVDTGDLVDDASYRYTDGCSAAATKRGIEWLADLQNQDADQDTRRRAFDEFAAARARAVKSWMNTHGALLASKALQRLEKAAFVGVTEKWERSICVLHKEIGGTSSPVELHSTRVLRADDAKAAQVRTEIESALQRLGIVDSADAAVYQKASDLLEQRAKELGC